MRFIGDVHGKYSPYKTLIKEVPASIQVGDMGVGFMKDTPDGEKKFMQNPPHDTMKKGNHRFIRGNHDNPTVCKTQPFWIKDGHYEDDMFFVGGGLSIDRHWRIEGQTWWADEELSYREFSKIQEKYLDLKPKIMVTHDCPEAIAGQIMNTSNFQKLDDPSITRQALDNFFQLHKPELWIFGHWHLSFQRNILGTQFICLNELEILDV